MPAHHLLLGHKVDPLPPIIDQHPYCSTSPRYAHCNRACLHPRCLNTPTHHFAHKPLCRGSVKPSPPDTFSFAVVMYEVFSRRLLLSEQAAHAPSASDARRVAREWAQRVAQGHRPVMPPSWPEELRDLIADCWAQVGACAGQHPAGALLSATLPTRSHLSSAAPSFCSMP